MVKYVWNELSYSLDEEVSTYIKNWDLSSKLRLHGFNTEQEINTGTAILVTIERQVRNIIELVTKVRNNRMHLEEKIDKIKNQSKKISSKIDSHQYQSRHRCCPSFIKELGF
jgi:CII-binding regulator of phage lambda lysogenization HflD